MNRKPAIHGNRRSFSVSTALDKLGAAITKIKEEDGLTWKDVGRVLGRGEDQATQYGAGNAEMGFTSFLLGCKEWNGRFGADVLELIGCKLAPLDSAGMTDNERLSHLLHLAHLLSLALCDRDTPGSVDDRELHQIGSDTLDNAARGIEALRQRLARVDGQEVTNLKVVGQ